MSLIRTWTGQSQRSQRSQQSSQVHADVSPDAVSTQKASRPELRHAVSTNSTADPYAGYLNHLTGQQEGQLLKFKSTLVERGLYRPASNGQAPSHDDQTLLRYLRARKFDVQGALGQFSDTEKWFRENRVAELYESIDVEFYEKARRLYPQWTGHRDRRGIPVYVYVVKYLDTKHVNSYTKAADAYKAKLPNHSSLNTPAKMLALVALYENLLGFVMPLCTSIERKTHPEVPVTNSNNIVDISGVGLRQFWNLKSHMQESSVLATAHYPETLDRIFIIGAPSFFPTVWGWIKHWFDPVTVNKIFVIPQNEVKSRLSEYIHPDDIPKKYGGNLDWEFGMTPHMDDAARQAAEKNGTNGWIEGPCLWEQNQRVPVGTVGGKPRRPAKLESMEVTPKPIAAIPAPLASVTPNDSAPPIPVINPDSGALPSPPPPPEAPVKLQQDDDGDRNDEATTTIDAQTPTIFVSNGEISQTTTSEKPPIQRFVTAAETLKDNNNNTNRPAIVPNGVL